MSPQEAHVNSAAASLDDFALHTAADRLHRAWLGTWSLGISPISLVQAWQDWAMHLAISPGKQRALLEDLTRVHGDFLRSLATVAGGAAMPDAAKPLPQDHRFADPAWKALPFSIFEQGFLLTEQWWHKAATGVDGVTAPHTRLVDFYARQLLDTLSPSNFAFTNPEVIKATLQEGGMNLLRGAGYAIEDLVHDGAPHEPSGAFTPGTTVAVTPGKVVYRNQLIELIQYGPTTQDVAIEPLLIVPAWIMKYYILDLSPDNSMIRYLVDQGFTVFCISWVNPDETHRDVSFEDYLDKGVMAAIEAVKAITGEATLHAAGYCLGGTLLSIAASAMARDGDDSLKSLTLLAAQVDFDEPGELGLFIDESQLSFLEAMMWKKGYLEQRQMAGAFEMLRSQDLVWSRGVREYLMGEKPQENDLMAWNADATRMPYRMHSEYLRRLYLGNDLSQGRFHVHDRPVHLEDVGVPVFAVGTETDHVAPWKSVFKLVHLFDTEVDFVLTSGGHNAGIVSEPGHPHRHYRLLNYRLNHPHPDGEEWAANAPEQQGSWWLEWVAWLKRHSSGTCPARQPGNSQAGYEPIMDAPGSYVMIR